MEARPIDLGSARRIEGTWGLLCAFRLDGEEIRRKLLGGLARSARPYHFVRTRECVLGRLCQCPLFVLPARVV